MLGSLTTAGIVTVILSTSTFLVSAAPEAVHLLRGKAPAGSLPPRGYAQNGSPHALTSVPTSNDGNFWFTNFDIGNAKNLSILIDTGSPDLILNPGAYRSGKNSVGTGQNFTITYATTNSDGSGTETVNGTVVEDTVTLTSTSLSSSHQTLGNTTTTNLPGLPFPHDGLMGFYSPGSTLGNDVSNWFTNICAGKEIASCRFGLALQTDDTGLMYFGAVGASEYDGPLSTAPISNQWSLYGDLAVNGKVLARDARIVTDSGTTTIIGPISDVQTLFRAAGVQSVLTPASGNNPASLAGYYPCDKPPVFGFGFPSISNASSASGPVSTKSTIFDVVPAALALNATGNNCTASIQGSDEFGFWLVGQAFMQGKYIDHDADTNTMGFANLKGS